MQGVNAVLHPTIALLQTSSLTTVVQQEIERGTRSTHIAVWLMALIFSTIHLQFAGFLPRFLLGQGGVDVLEHVGLGQAMVEPALDLDGEGGLLPGGRLDGSLCACQLVHHAIGRVPVQPRLMQERMIAHLVAGGERGEQRPIVGHGGVLAVADAAISGLVLVVAVPALLSGQPLTGRRILDVAIYIVAVALAIVPHWATWEHFDELAKKGLIMYGQMTAGSWIYIGTQGILQGTYETFGALARLKGWGSLKGKFVLTAGLGGMGGAQPLSITMNEGVGLIVEVDPERAERRRARGRTISRCSTACTRRCARPSIRLTARTRSSIASSIWTTERTAALVWRPSFPAKRCSNCC